MTEYDDVKDKAVEARNSYLDFIKSHPKTVAVVLLAVAGVTVFAFIS